MMTRRLNQASGLTLIELIATIAIAGVIMVMILPYFQSGITDSHRPAQWLQEAVTLERTMEYLNTSYQATGRTAADLKDFYDAIGNAGATVSNFTYKGYNYNAHPNNVPFRIEEKSYIDFHTNGNEQGQAPYSTNIVKITISNLNMPGYQLTQLFTVH
jgi:prepilin-type N-terminal cleavage/methylation domain-containing protein